ncbi:MAG: nuclear transport factor 2 family protein [Planctomycetales bacterium]|nr:nuclear transport factor 2 family protein [Planctomycetales bacterium]
MENRGDGGIIAAVIGLVLILLLLGGGAGTFYLIREHRLALAIQAERALMAEAQARAEVELARAAADVQAANRLSANEKESAALHEDSVRKAVTSILTAQQDAWNRGDIDAFMEHYWKSEELTFSSEGKTTRGWKATLTRYQERYPTPKEMGRLKLDELEITPLGSPAAMVLGKWNVERESGPLSGNFTLVVRKFDENWLIVHDHTSRSKD